LFRDTGCCTTGGEKASDGNIKKPGGDGRKIKKAIQRDKEERCKIKGDQGTFIHEGKERTGER